MVNIRVCIHAQVSESRPCTKMATEAGHRYTYAHTTSADTLAHMSGHPWPTSASGGHLQNQAAVSLCPLGHLLAQVGGPLHSAWAIAGHLSMTACACTCFVRVRGACHVHVHVHAWIVFMCMFMCHVHVRVHAWFVFMRGSCAWPCSRACSCA